MRVALRTELPAKATKQAGHGEQERLKRIGDGLRWAVEASLDKLPPDLQKLLKRLKQ